MLMLAREKGMVKVVKDEYVTPTFTEDLARQIVSLVPSEAYGLYHASAEGSCSWYEFAAEIFRVMDTKVELNGANSSDFPAKTPRPQYSVLENQALKARGLNRMRHWSVGLEAYLSRASVTPSI
jgi:dTDP-4-dehydrorhamnose reductase